MGNELVLQDSNLPDEPWPSFVKDGHKYELRNDRVVRDGSEVAVLVSPGFGAGFVSWNEGISPFEPKVVAALLAGRKDLLMDTDRVGRELGLTDDYYYAGGVHQLRIKWIPLGTRFGIREYDGSEYVITVSDLPYTA